MNTLHSLLAPIWAVPLELLLYDLARAGVLGLLVLAGLVSVLALALRRIHLAAGSLLLGASLAGVTGMLLRPAMLPAYAVLAGALIAAGVALLFLRRRATFTGAAAGALAMIALVAGAGFHVVWTATASPRATVLEEQRRRPDGLWPRWDGHTTVAGYGAEAEDRGWIEAGGGFSPAFASFGLSVWIMGADGEVLATSDTLPRSETRHRYELAGGQMGVVTETAHHRLTVIPTGLREYALTLDDLTGPDASLALVVRSVGPAGGAVEEVLQDGDTVLINNRWVLGLDGAGAFCLGDEISGGLSNCTERDRIESGSGWAFARLPVEAATLKVSVADRDVDDPALMAWPMSSGVALTGFPDSFTDRLHAQTATLLGSVVGSETRPGDPINYPLSWQRDGAYILVALARAGFTDAARDVARELAEKDFYGGFGSEADAPGLALWALGETSAALGDPAFDEWVWPHVVRKVGLIEQMLTLESEMRVAPDGPIVPRAEGRSDIDLVASAAVNGLIAGRMDWQVPVFFVNAVSFAGLDQAAALARRTGAAEEAAAWRSLATDLRQTWRARFAAAPDDDPERTNPRTIISGLWPTGVAESEAFAPLVESSWAKTPMGGGPRPRWTYFTIAEGHQWLRLGDLERVGQTLDWLDAADVIPGLQVFWEGDGEENSSGFWQGARGHVAPPGVAPHYWTAAEALLLSLEMLAYVDGDGRLVVGAGVAPEWLEGELGVRDVGTSVGPVSWRWDGQDCVEVSAPEGIEVVLGRGLPEDALISTSACAEVGD